MATRKPPLAKGKSQRRPSFSSLLKGAPKVKNFRRVRLSGLLFRSEKKSTFVLQTADGSFYELNSASVGYFKVLEKRDGFTLLEIEVPADAAVQLSALAPNRLVALDAVVGSAVSLWSASTAADAVAHLHPLREESSHPIHQHWRFDQPDVNPFTKFDNPL
jgi:hypothetical protein